MSGIQGALKFWQEFSISEFQKELDSEGQAVAKRQDESEASRKKLVELSREFKKSSSEDVRRKVAPILKSFQMEVDSLSRRSNSAEAAFLGTYKRILEIPDPIPVLEQALSVQQRLQQAQDHEIEVKQLRETLQEYNKEFAQVKNQEVTIQKLREQLKNLEDEIEDRAATKISEKSAELVKAFEEKDRALQIQLDKAVQKASKAEQKASTVQSALEATQSELFELKNKYDEEASAKSAELDIVLTDLERANQKVSALEKELEAVGQTEWAKLSAAEDSGSSSRVELELEIQAKDKEISRLADDMQRLQSMMSRLQEASSSQVQALEKQLGLKDVTICGLESKIAAQGDYDELKRELDVIKMVEFSSPHASDSQFQSDSTDGGNMTSPSKPLEVLLLEKNRALQNENTSLKLELSELREHFSSLQQQHSYTHQTAQDQKNLIVQLEKDLSSVQPYLPLHQVEGARQSGTSPGIIMSEALRGSTAIATSAVEPVVGGAESLLPIVSSQRERFKQRNAELEAECHQQKQSISVLQREVDTLRGDNVKLYEKIRFLQSYPGTRKTVDEQEAMGRYSSQYEASLDPFAAFGAKERQKRYSQLSGIDKATLVMGRFILSNKVARVTTFVYALVLHLLVFLVISRLVYSDSCESGTFMECARLFSEHMQMYHPQHAKEILDGFGPIQMKDKG